MDRHSCKIENISIGRCVPENRITVSVNTHISHFGKIFHAFSFLECVSYSQECLYVLGHIQATYTDYSYVIIDTSGLYLYSCQYFIHVITSFVRLLCWFTLTQIPLSVKVSPLSDLCLRLFSASHTLFRIEGGGIREKSGTSSGLQE